MRALIFDPFAGISGDMTLGALIDLGLEPAWLRAFVASLQVGDIAVNVERVNRRGISCGRVYFDLPHEHAHRHLRHVLEIIDRTQTSQTVKKRAGEAFRRIAVAEAAIHGTTVEKVHFHEVGALDAILDIVCAMAAFEQLGFEAFYTRPIALGTGWIRIAHGDFPVPAPATLKILEGYPTSTRELQGECTTPTGAAIIATLVQGRAPAEVTVLASGYGAGTRDPEDRPNCVRLVACEIADATATLHLVQSDVDDLPPEYVPAAQEALLAAGAVDAVAVSIGMKKGRPGVRIEALVPEDRLDAVLAALFKATSTIGARHWPVTRPALARQEEVVEWRGQKIRRKRVRLPDGAERVKPEYDDVVRASQQLGLSPYEVRLALEQEPATKPVSEG